MDFEVRYSKYKGGIEPPEVVAARQIKEAVDASTNSQATVGKKKKGVGVTITGGGIAGEGIDHHAANSGGGYTRSYARFV